MLTNDNDKYKMCPIFNHLISRKPMVGDYILTLYEGVSVITSIYSEEFEEGVQYKYANYFTLLPLHDYGLFYRDYSNSISLNDSFDDLNKDYVVITEELKDIIIKHIDSKTLEKIAQITLKKDRDYLETYLLYMFLYRIYTHLNSIVSDDIDKMILLSLGIKKVLKKHKNNGLRDVLLGNGQVWQIKKRKAKGMLRKRIALTNRNIIKSKSEKKKIKSVHYTIIKRLDEHEVLIS